MTRKIPSELWWIAGGVTFLAFFAYFVTDKAGQTVAAAANAINPLNENNVFASGLNDIGQKVSGDSGWSLGGWIYDVTHPAYDPNKPGPTVAEGTGGASQFNQPGSGGFTTSSDGLDSSGNAKGGAAFA